MELKELIVSLAKLMSVSGNETLSHPALCDLIGEIFDEHSTDAVGNHLFIKRCGRENAPKILIDTHFDEIGMMVTDIRDDGFLTVTNIGGVDTRILPTGEVIVYGKQPIYGVIASLAPHLMKPEDKNNLKPIGEMMIDTGYPKETLEEYVSIGTPVGFKPIYKELQNGRICGKAFDDKACAACAICGIESCAAEDLAGDVYFLLSASEELGGRGAKVAGFGIRPDYALVIDVTHAAIPDVETRYLSPMDSGVVVEASAVTGRRLTNMMIDLCRRADVPYTVQASPSNTGTNANLLGTAGEGIPTVLVSLPIKNMHSAAEMLSLTDAEALVRTVAAFACSGEIAEVYGK